MWEEIGTTVRAAMKDWGTTVRLCVLVVVLALAASVVMWGLAA